MHSPDPRPRSLLPGLLSRPSVPRAFAAVAIVAVLAGACGGSTAATAAPGPSAGASVAGATPAGSSAAASSGSAPGSQAGGGAGGPVTPTAPASPPAPSTDRSAGPLFPGGLLIADGGNGRLLIVNDAHRILWQFPVAGSVPAGQRFAADDAFVSPDGKTITANEEELQVVVRIDIATRRIVWEYGHYGRKGSAAGFLDSPDDAYPLANGDVMVADIFNCRVIEIAPDKRIVRQWGRTGVCRSRPPYTYDEPNGDTPLPDGGLLITEIRGSRVVRLDAAGRVLFDIHVPVHYPSDAQLDPQGNVIVSDYWRPGAVVAVSPKGVLLWRYGPASGPGMLDHPSLAVPRPDGTVVLNDDFRHRVIVIDPRSGRIVWQYGRTGVAGTGPDRLAYPDGLDQLPPGVLPNT